MDPNRSLKGSIKLNLKHKLDLSPSEEEILGKTVRGSDVPLFWGKGKDNLGIEIRTLYNHCMNLLAFKPKVMNHHPLSGTEEEVNVTKLIKKLKHEKKEYSKVWKDNFNKYKHELTQSKIDYDDTDPFDDKWMKHELLEKSIEMQEAAAEYLQLAEEILKGLDDTYRSMKAQLEEIAAGNSMTLDDWEQMGANQVTYKLARAQTQVDTILEEEWQGVSRFLGELHAGIHPSYIGSTNTGHKSITKAYVQFNPDDFDVDGQLKASLLFMALADLNVPASKGRYFVRLVTEPAIQAILNLEHQVPRISAPEEARLKELKKLLMELFKYVERVEARIPDEIRGIMKDDEDPFDLAIVMG
ncbi:MAG: hypothetical protein ACRBFS_01000 [Aureispira sp.]